MTTLKETTKKTSVWNGRINLNFRIKGQGPALVYFHPAAGLAWDPFLDKLSERFTIHAPEFPGTTPGDPYAIHQVDDLADAVFFYEEAIRQMGLVGSIAVGQSFGGMLAIELSAAFPDLFSKLIVLDPIGLWRDEAPVANWMTASAQELPAMLFKDPMRPAAQALLAMPEEPEAAVVATAQLIWNYGATGKMVWPIPDRGMKKRLHRVKTPSLIVWGENDAMIASSYAHELARQIKGSQVEIVADCGHIPQVEQSLTTFRLVSGFLGTTQETA
ncbi:alpha/beta hydrolase [Bradyrhizobium symbiodeficiens]|uniref:Alpha/beta hydrolase n=1 Tax=Bradyrhizobium symbiodeficiens TaxID=1404367 RepID=A0ABX5W4Y0_9BRAD|nr:alpha/beta hydrolase [Bradyrhizobium symbiodeficiens]QDF37497.1 alpha/beta hydrolase [Bradyrhizobium symbiodeficiens]